MAIVFNIDASSPASYAGTGSIWYDISGNGNNVSLINSPTWNSEGWFNFVYSNNQYGTFSDVNLAGGAASRSVSIWFNVSGTTGNFQYITSYGTITTGTGNGVALQTSTLSSYYVGANADLDSFYSSKTNVWNNTIVTYNGTTAKIYVNGFLRAAGNLSWNTSKTGTAYICRSPWGPTERFSGKLSSIKYWNNALTDAEVYTEYTTSFKTFFQTSLNFLNSGKNLEIQKHNRNAINQIKFFTSEPQLVGPVVGPNSHADRPNVL